SLGQLWANGVEVDWGVFHSTEQRSRISLPAYPFERQTYWVGTNASANSVEVRDPFNWFYRAIWQEEPLGASKTSTLAGRRILVLDRETSPGAAIVERLLQLGCDVIRAGPGDAYAHLNEREWVLNPDHERDFHELAASVCDSETRLSGVIDCWSATSLASGEAAGTDLDMAAAMGLLAPMRLAHALSAQQTVRPLPVLLLAAGTTRVLDTDAMDPPRALSAGVARVLPQEHPGLRVAHIDADGAAVADIVLAELAAGAPQAALAIRNGKRFVEAFEPVTIRTAKPPADLPASPVVLITGGLGHMGI